MRKAQTIAKRIREWELLSSNIEPLLGEMPHLQEIMAAIAALIAEARALDGEQEVTRGKLQDIVHRRQEIEKRGETLRSRVTSHLKGSFGFSSDELVKFGVRPRATGPRGPRKSKAPAAAAAAGSEG